MTGLVGSEIFRRREFELKSSFIYRDDDDEARSEGASATASLDQYLLYCQSINIFPRITQHFYILIAHIEPQHVRSPDAENFTPVAILKIDRSKLRVSNLYFAILRFYLDLIRSVKFATNKSDDKSIGRLTRCASSREPEKVIEKKLPRRRD